MNIVINIQDRDLLTSIAEYRVLTLSQMAALHRRNLQALRRRLRQFKTEGLIRITPGAFGGQRGRPEQVISLSPKGVEALVSTGNLPSTIPCHNVTAEELRHIDHQLLMNDFRIQLVQTTGIIPSLGLTFYSSTSPQVVDATTGTSLIREAFTVFSPSARQIEFIPDAVFCLNHSELNKTLLFFLEVDRGTESLVGRQGSGNDIRQKIFHYQHFFYSGTYKRYENILKTSLLGFRLLFLAAESGRFKNLCRLVLDMPPSDFIWLTDHDRLIAQGVWADIWAPGGNESQIPNSILGRLKPDPGPTPATLSKNLLGKKFSLTGVWQTVSSFFHSSTENELIGADHVD
jgi:hypothetical protein